jgi:CBS domain-containing protein
MTITGTVDDVLRQKGPERWSIPAEASVYEALECMAEHDVGALLVESRGRFVGVICERDYSRKVVLLGRASKTTRVGDILSPRPMPVSPETDVAECMRVMAERDVRHLAVADGADIIGLVSMGDVVRWIISFQEFTIDRLEEYIMGVYPA